MSTLRVSRTIAWPRNDIGVDWYRASIVLDDAGSFALVRYVDVHKGLRGGLLWDLAKDAVVPGEHIDLHPDQEKAVRRDAKGVQVIDLASGRVLAKIDDRLDVALSPDAAFVVQRPRPDAEKKIVRATTRVHPVSGGKALELPTNSVLEAFVDDSRLASVSQRGAVTIWDLATGKAVGKLPGLGKPASIRVDPSGARIALSAFDGQYAVYDVHSQKPVAKGKSKIIFNDDARFDGTRFMGTNILFDVTTKKGKSHEKGWLKGRQPSGRTQTALIEHPKVGVITQRDILGKPVVELWDVDAETKLASVEVEPRADAIAFAASTLAVAHLPANAADWPAVTVLTMAKPKPKSKP